MNKATGLLLLAALIMIGCKDKKEQTLTQPMAVKTMTVAQQAAGDGQTFAGTMEETVGTQLSFNVSGTLRSINVSTGSRVTKGQLIAEVDDATLRNSHDIALATLSQAEDAYTRMKQLHDAGSLPEIQWVEVQSKLSQAQSAERIARKNLTDSHLYAPFSGVIAEKNAEAGQNVLPGAPVVKLVKTEQVKVKIAVPENEISQIKVGGTAIVSVSALGGKTYTGRIIEKGVSANALTRSYDVKAIVSNPTGELMPGMICDVSLAKPGTATTVIMLPANIIQIDKDNRPFVWTATNGKAHKAYITTSDVTDRGVIVTSGLKAGDNVITEGQQKVSEGTAVKG